MVGDEGPCKTVGFRFLEEGKQTFDKGCPVRIITADVPLFNTADNNVLEQSWHIKSCLAWHERRIAVLLGLFNN